MKLKDKFERNIIILSLVLIIRQVDFIAGVFALFFLAKGLSMTQIMLIQVAATLTILIAEIPSGAFADRFGRKISIIISTLFLIAVNLIYAFGNTFYTFIIAGITLGFCWSFISGADNALLYDTLVSIKKEKQFSKILGRIKSLEIITLGIMSIISGYLATIFNYSTLFLMCAGTSFIAFILSLFLTEPPMKKHLQDKNYFKHIKKAVHFSITHHKVRDLIIYYGLFAAFGHSTYFIIQPFFDISYPKYIVGLAVSLYFIFAGVGHLMSHKIMKILNEKTLLITLIFAAGISFIILPFVGLILSLICIIIMTFSCGVRDNVITKIMHIHTDSHHRATIDSVKSMSKNIMYALFAPLIGYVYDIYSPGMTFLAMGITLLVFSILVIIFLFKED